MGACNSALTFIEDEFKRGDITHNALVCLRYYNAYNSLKPNEQKKFDEQLIQLLQKLSLPASSFAQIDKPSM